MKIHIPDASHISALRLLWKEAFGDTDTFLDTFFKTAFSQNRCLVATIDNNVAAALYWFDCSYNEKRIAYIYAVATALASRGQGICHKLMEDTHVHLKKLGYEGAILVPGNTSLFDFYESLGYYACCNIHQLYCCCPKQEIHSSHSPNDKCSGSSSTNTINLKKIDKHQYARLRRDFLPKGSIIQEHENLDFLETQADFYMGEKLLLVARVENDTLNGLELLGDTNAAPAITHALGCFDGIFRTPGNSTPFAMYHSLTDNGSGNSIPPSYFAFAFD